MKKDGSISTSTQLCAVIGNPVAHSLSPALHNAAFDALGLDYVYTAFRVEDLKSAIAGMRALENFRGMSVTIPHKIEVIDYLDEVGDIDRSIGSINTVINEKGRLCGFGTDGPGALKAILDAGVNPDDSNVLMLGAGGASRAIAFTLARSASIRKLVMTDINEPMLRALAADLRSGTDVAVEADLLGPDTIAARVSEADIIINCTPVGMHPNEDSSLVPPALFRRGQVVFDVVYTPLETKLLKEAASKGCIVISGVEMFVNQAVLQFEMFTGADAPVDVMRKVLMERLKG
ncbi:MAG TPA: shikimate dehydrogenase [Geobacteraceae bacterium]|nr:shikimate dehydrogenase [Geobacteraceae bacterium]